MLRQFGAHTRPQIAGHANFDRNLALRQFLDQFRILGSGKPVPNSFRLEVQRTPDRFWSGVFAGVRGAMKAMFRGTPVDSLKQFRWAAALIAANTERNHVAILKPNGEIKHPFSFFRAKLPDCVENPQERNPEIFHSALVPALQPLENRSEILLAP